MLPDNINAVEFKRIIYQNFFHYLEISSVDFSWKDQTRPSVVVSGYDLFEDSFNVIIVNSINVQSLFLSNKKSRVTNCRTAIEVVNYPWVLIFFSSSLVQGGEWEVPLHRSSSSYRRSLLISDCPSLWRKLSQFVLPSPTVITHLQPPTWLRPSFQLNDN